MNTTIHLTKESFDANFHPNGVFHTSKYIYKEYIVSKAVFNQLCPIEYQDNVSYSNDTYTMKATSQRLLIVNRITNERLTLLNV